MSALDDINRLGRQPGYGASVVVTTYPAMTIYDVLARCVESSRWVDEEEKRRALELVEEARQLNLFGTVASQLRTEEGSNVERKNV